MVVLVFDIAEEFRKVYSELYNLEDDFTALEEMKEALNLDISKERSEEEIDKVTEDVVREAAKRLKPGKGDVSGSYNSDLLKNCPDYFFFLLAAVFRSWLTHGTVTRSFLACAFLPLVKGLKDPSLTASYRAVASSSLILKLLDYVILDLWGEQLASDSLQFGYKRGTSTTDCSWLVTSVADHFLRHGSPIKIATLDAKQGFDRCSWLKIFESLRLRLPAVISRILMFVYTQQSAYTRWGSAISAPFGLSNSTRQGSVISPAIWCVYMEELIARLRKLGLGCSVHGVFMGVTVYADDVVILAPSRNALAEMLKVTEIFATEYKNVFSTNEDPAKSKSKCIYMTGKEVMQSYPAPVMLNGRPLPWVMSAAHLGHELSQACSPEHAAWVARAKYIDRAASVQEMFSFAEPAEILAAVRVNCCDFYGSNLWNLFGVRAGQVYRSYNTTVKLAWDLPRSTHTWLVTHLLGYGLPSARETILSGFTGFLARLRRSASREVRIMAEVEVRDATGVTGRNVALFERELGSDPRSLTPSQTRDLVRAAVTPIHPEEEWKLELLRDMLEERGELKAEGKDKEVELLQSYCDILAEV